MSYSRNDDKGTLSNKLLSGEGIELLATGVLDCLSLLELPRLLVPLSVERFTCLLLWGQPVLLVELGKAKGQEKFAGDLMVAEKTSSACITGTS